MNRFPDNYEKPELILLNNGLNSGWSALCDNGTNASSPCSTGFGVTPSGDSTSNDNNFINPETLNQTERRSNLLTD